MKYDSILKITEQLEQNNYYKDSKEVLRISFEDLRFIEPAGAILFLSTIDKIKESNVPYELVPIDTYRHKPAISYGESMGIFQMLGISESSSYSSGKTYIAPTKIDLIELRHSLSRAGKTIEAYFEIISEEIVVKALELVGTFLEEDLKDLFRFVIREMIRNIFDHSQTSHFYYALQTYENSKHVEVVIADIGIGLLATVPFDIEEKWLNENTDENAIRKALLPGVSAYSNHSYAPDDYKNSGYGLALVKKIIQKTNGRFSIASGAKSLTYSGESETVQDCDVNGTLIRMRIDLNNLKNVKFQEVLEEAETEALETGLGQTPSTASKTIKSKNIT